MREFMKLSLMAFLFCVALVMTSCSKEEMTIGEIGDKITVTAYVDNSDTKVTSEFNTVENKYTFAWEENDEFSVIRNTDNKTFTKDARENTFTGATVDPEGSGAYYAIHPVTTAVDHTAATFDISDQSEDAAYVLYSSTNDVNTFKFKHAMAYLRLSLPDGFDGARCDITITTPTGVFTNGEINLGNGTLDYTNSTKNYIKLNRLIDKDNPLLVAIPPMETGNKSLTFSIKKGDDYYEATLDGNPANEIVAGKYYTASIVPTVITPYVTFTAAEAQTLKYVFYHKPYSSELEYPGEDLDIDLEWSKNRNTWTVFEKETVVSFGGETKVYVRARIENGTANADGTAARLDPSTGEPTVWGKFVFSNNNVGVECSGDIRTLIDYNNYKNVGTNEAKFKKLFSGCKSLTTAPALPATTLAEYCYSYMFNGCTGLETAPELPATTLAASCYYAMFDGCTSLITAPALPATTLATSCYNQMFRNCKSLTTAPALLATTLATSCYFNMFNGCTNLTQAPVLPATTLAKECYSQMFSGCTRLTTAPSLPATTLAEYCYGSMFSGCTGLEAAPELKATTLHKGCYNAMFSNTGLLTAPELPATTMVESCYNQMFSYCKSLTTAPELQATELAIKCYRQMFFMCISLATAPALPATTLAKECYIDMFRECRSLTTAPVLQATTLAESCYNQMFMSCTKLNNIVMLATDISASNCLNNWVSGVAATGTFIKAASMESLPAGVSGIPSGWTVTDYGQSEN